jgi:hypothetical protein
MSDAYRLDPSGTPARPQGLFGIPRLLKNIRLAAACVEDAWLTRQPEPDPPAHPADEGSPGERRK